VLQPLPRPNLAAVQKRHRKPLAGVWLDLQWRGFATRISTLQRSMAAMAALDPVGEQL
jgi:hypothetical protein